MVPSRLPKARLTINKTGYSVFGIFPAMALIPIAHAANPIAWNNAPWYFSWIPFFKRLPTILPVNMVHVFTIVPIILPFSPKLCYTIFCELKVPEFMYYSIFQVKYEVSASAKSNAKKANYWRNFSNESNPLIIGNAIKKTTKEQ